MRAREKSPAVTSAPEVLLGEIRQLIDAARQRAATAVNSELTLLYWRIGERIHTQVLAGRRAEYGEEIVATLSQQLMNDCGRKGDNEKLRCQVGISSSQGPVRHRDAMQSRFVTASKGKDRNSSQTVMSSRIRETLKSQIVTLNREAHLRSQTVTFKHGENSRCLPYPVSKKRASIPTDLQFSEHASQR